MPRSPLCTVAAVLAIVLSACSHADATAHDTAKIVAKTPASNNGSVAPAGAPQDTISMRADSGRILGDPTAKLWVIMASDFQCPYCKAWHDANFAGIVRDYVATHKVHMAYLNMPLSIHPNAQPAAEAAMCASAQGKFWPMHDSLFASQLRWENLQDPHMIYDALAQQIGVNMTDWRLCVAQHLTLPLIMADRDRARGSGVNSTPVFFVGSQALIGADAKVREAIDAALAAPAGKKPAN